MNSHLLGGVGKYNAVLEYLGWGKYNEDSYFEKIVRNISGILGTVLGTCAALTALPLWLT